MYCKVQGVVPGFPKCEGLIYFICSKRGKEALNKTALYLKKYPHVGMPDSSPRSSYNVTFKCS